MMSLLRFFLKTKTYHILLVTMRDDEKYYHFILARSKSDALNRFAKKKHYKEYFKGEFVSNPGNKKILNARYVKEFSWLLDTEERIL